MPTTPEVRDDEAPSLLERYAARFLSATNTTRGFWFVILGFLAILTVAAILFDGYIAILLLSVNFMKSSGGFP